MTAAQLGLFPDDGPTCPSRRCVHCGRDAFLLSDDNVSCPRCGLVAPRRTVDALGRRLAGSVPVASVSAALDRITDTRPWAPEAALSIAIKELGDLVYETEQRAAGMQLDQGPGPARVVRPEGLEAEGERAFTWELSGLGVDDVPVGTRPARATWTQWRLYAPNRAIAAMVSTSRGRAKWLVSTPKGASFAEGLEGRVPGDRNEALRRAMERCEAELVPAGWAP